MRILKFTLQLNFTMVFYQNIYSAVNEVLQGKMNCQDQDKIPRRLVAEISLYDTIFAKFRMSTIYSYINKKASIQN
jgi:hypothetical protein